MPNELRDRKRVSSFKEKKDETVILPIQCHETDHQTEICFLVQTLEESRVF